MSRLKLALVLFLLPAAARAACNLQMSLSCDRQGSSSSCQATTLNAGADTCSGAYYVGFEALSAAGTVSGFNSGLGLSECFNSADFPQSGLPSFTVCYGNASLGPNSSFTSTAQVTGAAGATAVPFLAFTLVEDPVTGDQRGLAYALSDVSPPTCTPSIAAASQSQSGVPYSLVWSPVSEPSTTYQVDESTSADFSSGVSTLTVSALTTTFQHSVTATTTYHYRVRATSCGGSTGPYSEPTSVIVLAAPVSTTRDIDAVVPFGSTAPVDIKIFIPAPAGLNAKADPTFTAVTDKPYLKVTPATGTIPPGGTTLTVTASPSGLPAGGNTGTVTVTSGTGAVIKSQSVTVSLVTPVGPASKTLPSSNTLIIPVVTHVNGASAQFLSDVRLTNASSSEVKYQLTFTPTKTDATKASKVTVVPVGAAQTIALNDIAKDFFGYGATGDPSDVGFGSLEIRPLNSTSALNYASSRTYAVNALGTFGQFIAAVPFTKFATNAVIVPPIAGGGSPPSAILSFQQVAQSSKFRTNLGIVEGSGSPASGRIRVLDDVGTLLKEVPYSLQPGEHQQLNRFIQANAGIENLEDGRIEITVDSLTGAVSGYASVLDNLTDDPLAVMPVSASTVSASRYVLPGMADLGGTNNFHSDIRIYNGGTSSALVTPTYYPQNGGAAVTGPPITIEPGRVYAKDNVLPSLFNALGSGGSIVLTTSGNSSLVATGRTYTIKSNGGTFGQFIPGVSPSEGVGVGDRALQVLQLEQSRSFRSNVGLAELSGNPATVQITISVPDSKVSPVVPPVELQANQFLQLNSILNTYFPGANTYNARVSISVIGGSGRVTAYGSVIDYDTGDPTYVPAQ